PVLFNHYPDDSTMASRGTVASRLRHNLSITSGLQKTKRSSRMLYVAFFSPAPLEAANVVNYTISAYSRLSTKQNRESASAAVEFLKKEKNNTHQELNTAEIKLKHFRNNNKVVK